MINVIYYIIYNFEKKMYNVTTIYIISVIYRNHKNPIKYLKKTL